MQNSRTRPLRWQVAYEQIKADLLEGRYKPGDFIKVIDIAAEQDMSRYPVMDALKQLAAESMVEIVPQVGCRVAPVHLDEVSLHFRFMARAEGLIAELAVERGNERQVRELNRTARAIEALAREGLDEKRKIQHYRLLNREFHGVVHEMAAAPTLVEMIAKLWDRNDFYISAMPGLLFLDRLDDAITEHRAILNALEKQDAVAARLAAEEHALRINEHLQRLIQRNAAVQTQEA